MNSAGGRCALGSTAAALLLLVVYAALHTIQVSGGAPAQTTRSGNAAATLTRPAPGPVAVAKVGEIGGPAPP